MTLPECSHAAYVVTAAATYKALTNGLTEALIKVPCIGEPSQLCAA